MNNRLLNEKEVAEYLGLSEAWVRKSRMFGNGPTHIRCGGSIRYRLKDIETWLDSQQHTNTIRKRKENAHG